MLPPTAFPGAAIVWGQLRRSVAPSIASASRAAATTCAMGNAGGAAAACWSPRKGVVVCLVAAAGHAATVAGGAPGGPWSKSGKPSMPLGSLGITVYLLIPL